MNNEYAPANHSAPNYFQLADDHLVALKHQQSEHKPATEWRKIPSQAGSFQPLQQFGCNSESIIYATKIIRPLTHFNVFIMH